jgi:hypothetical protein
VCALDFQKIKAEVAKRHHVVLDENDPILVTLTLHELIINGYLERMQALLVDAQNQISATSAQQEETSKAIASRIVTGAADYIADEIQKNCDALQGRLNEAFKHKLDEINQAKQVVIWAAFVALAAVSFAIGTNLASWLHK